jgi:hypothetical protein
VPNEDFPLEDINDFYQACRDCCRSGTDLRQHYGAAIGEVYRTPSHLMVTAYFDEDGNICREHVESEDRGRRMTNNEVKTVLDEIAPENERGKYKIGTVLNIGCPDNDCAGVSEDNERLEITKIGTTSKYRYVSVVYHSTECKHLEADTVVGAVCSF